MRKDGHFLHDSDDDLIDYAEPDDIPAVLAELQKLAQRSRHPMVRVCLEQAYDDIAYLTTYSDQPRDDDRESTLATG